MDLSTRRHDNYRVILKLDEGEFEIGSMGIKRAAGVQYLTSTPPGNILARKA
jgi:hypothetical protein